MAPIDPEGNLRRNPTKPLTNTPTFSNSRASRLAVDAAKLSNQRALRTIYNIAGTNYLGNGDKWGWYRRTKDMKHVNLRAHKEMENGFEDAYPGCTWWGKDAGGIDVEKKREILKFRTHVELMQKAFPPKDFALGYGEKVEFRETKVRDEDGTFVQGDRYIDYVWCAETPQGIGAAVKAATNVGGVWQVNKAASNGLILNTKRGNSMFSDDEVARRLLRKTKAMQVEDNEKFLLRKAFSIFRAAKMKLKSEVTSSEVYGPDGKKGTRIFAVTNPGPQSILAVMLNAAYKGAPCGYQGDFDMMTGNYSWLGMRPYGGDTDDFFQNLLPNMRRLYKEHDRQRLIWVYSDNIYTVWYDPVADDVEFVSLDAEKMEANHTKATTQRFIVKTLIDSFGATPKYGRNGGFSSLDYEPDPSRPHTAKGGIAREYLDFTLNNAVLLMCDIPMVVKNKIIESLGLFSGVQGTSYGNNAHSGSGAVFVDEHISRKLSLVKLFDVDGMFDEDVEFGNYLGHVPGPYGDKESYRLTDEAATCFYAATGTKYKVELVVPNLYQKLATGQTVLADLLGNDLRQVTVAKERHFIAVLNKERMYKAIAFDKFKEGDQTAADGGARHIDTISKARMILLMGGILYQDTRDLLATQIKETIRRIKEFLRSDSGYTPSREDESLQRIAMALDDANLMGVDEYFHSMLTNFTKFTNGLEMPSFADFLTIHLGAEVAEKHITACLEEVDHSKAESAEFIKSQVPPGRIKEEVVAGNLPEDQYVDILEMQRVVEEIRLATRRAVRPANVKEAINKSRGRIEATSFSQRIRKSPKVSADKITTEAPPQLKGSKTSETAKPHQVPYAREQHRLDRQAKQKLRAEEDFFGGKFEKDFGAYAKGDINFADESGGSLSSERAIRRIEDQGLKLQIPRNKISAGLVLKELAVRYAELAGVGAPSMEDIKKMYFVNKTKQLIVQLPNSTWRFYMRRIGELEMDEISKR